MKKKNNNWTTAFLVLLLLAGVSLLLYPSLSDYWNSMHQTRAIASYAETVSQLDTAQYDEMWKAAQDYNRSLAQRETAFALTDEQKAAYESLLDVSGLGVMGYIEIPEIDCSLPIYHGTEESVLQVAVGHLEWSNLPVGGEGTHCVLSGHRGLPSAKLFTNLDKLAVGDTFLLRVLDEVLTYEVDQILIVEPEQVDALGIVGASGAFGALGTVGATGAFGSLGIVGATGAFGSLGIVGATDSFGIYGLTVLRTFGC